ncbi:MAG: DNA polymerase Y family protein [Phycisphaerales bacterium]|nr:DNA polymerase Y family protein [Phycisphaerales bacterium]
MARALCVYLNHWATDRARRRIKPTDRSDSATLLSRRDGQRELVAACCARAHSFGVRTGMTIAHARALLPSAPIIEPHEPERDDLALERLAAWASRRFSPTVAPEPPDALLLDITGCARLFRGEERLLRRLLTAVTRLGFSCRGAVAPTFLGAWALARFADRACTVIDNRPDLVAALAPLPTAALGLDDHLLDALDELGVRTIAQVSALPRAGLPSRFGEALLGALDRATGEAIETIIPVRPMTPPRFDLLFDGPTTHHESMTLAVRRALETIGESLARAECGARRIDLQLLRAGLIPELIVLQMSRPSRDPQHLWKLAEPRLERVHMGDGIEGVRAIARRMNRLAHTQLTGIGAHRSAPDRTDDDAAAFSAAMDALSSRLGIDSVLRMEAVASHLPERSSHLIPIMNAPSPRTIESETDAAWGRWGYGGVWRPSMLLDTPRPASVSLVTPEGPLLMIDRASVRSCAGPERIEPEWWRPHHASASWSHEARDYYRVQCTDGRWLWVFRTCVSGKWFVHGQWA